MPANEIKRILAARFGRSPQSFYSENSQVKKLRHAGRSFRLAMDWEHRRSLAKEIEDPGPKNPLEHVDNPTADGDKFYQESKKVDKEERIALFLWSGDV